MFLQPERLQQAMCEVSVRYLMKKSSISSSQETVSCGICSTLVPVCHLSVMGNGSAGVSPCAVSISTQIGAAPVCKNRCIPQAHAFPVSLVVVFGILCRDLQHYSILSCRNVRRNARKFTQKRPGLLGFADVLVKIPFSGRGNKTHVYPKPYTGMT